MGMPSTKIGTWRRSKPRTWTISSLRADLLAADRPGRAQAVFATVVDDDGAEVGRCGWVD
tara:strand:- start:1717 stop:1896 length:180 start_codon:yes stop_codon:yes gene_type:complete